MTEKLLTLKLVQYQKSKGRRVAAFVPVLSRVADVAYIHGGKLYTVEVKLRNVRAAIRQAQDHQFAADFAYICIPADAASNRAMQDCRIAGLGLMVNAEEDPIFRILVRPSRSPIQWDELRTKTIERIMEAAFE